MANGPGVPARRAPSIDDFLVEPTRDLADWRWLWAGDHEFPISSHRGFLGRLLVGLKRLFRPLVKIPQNDLWDRQSAVNLILLEHLERLEAARTRRPSTPRPSTRSCATTTRSSPAPTRSSTATGGKPATSSAAWAPPWPACGRGRRPTARRAAAPTTSTGLWR